MIFALLLIAAAPDWVPVRWPSSEPKSLELLAGTPVNCVLLEHDNWNPPLLQRAAKDKIATVAVLHPEATPIEYAREAVRLHMDGVALEGEYNPALGNRLRDSLTGSGLTVIELPSRAHIRLDSGDPVVGTWQGVWPGIEVQNGGEHMMGPTSTPWINTNTGFLRFVRAATDSAVWISVKPPPKIAHSVEQYAVSIADAATAGARWVMSFDDNFAARLLRGDKEAADDWRKIAAYQTYFDGKREWQRYHQYSQLALVQDANTGGLLSGSLLDMMAVQHTSVRPLPTRRLANESLHGARVVLDVDAASLDVQQRQALQDFKDHGGVLVDPPKAWRFPPISDRQTVLSRQQWQEIQKMWEVTYNATVRKNFGARTFNTASILFSLLETPDGKSALVHLLNYTDLPSESVTVHVLGDWKHARLYTPDGPPQELAVYPIEGGSGIDIDRITVLGTLRLD